MPARSNIRLQWGRNFSLDRAPQIQPTDASPSVLIVGGGVTGLITAWVLLDRGYYVTVLSKEWASYTKEQRLTSQIAGALWEYPPAACGQHTDAISQKHSKRWCMVAYRVWEAIAADPKLSEEAGVRMKESTFFFPCPVEEDKAQLSKMNEIMKSGVRGFRRDPSLTEKFNVDPAYGAVDAYQHLAPIIDTDVCTKWLMEMVQSKGARFLTETIYGDLYAQEDELRARFGADVIVNCTGLAGAEIAGDKTCYPIRGSLIRVINDGVDFPKVTSALTIAADAIHDANGIVFIVPRNDNILLLGGIAQSHEYKLDLTLDSPVIKRMRERCEAFLPALKNARVDPDYPLAQGLRPFRKQNVRVERELRRLEPLEGYKRSRQSRIVHSYGHGGSGWSLSFGCAEDVANLVVDALRGLAPRAMALEDQFIQSRL
jgi:D-amino-acid oxidase